MKKSFFIYIAICLTVLVSSCEDKLGDNYDEFEAIKPELSITQTALSVNGTEQTQQVAITSNSYWTATTNASWIHLETRNTRGNGPLYVKLAANPSVTTERMGTINVTDGINVLTISITQAPSVAVISVSKNNLDFAYDGGTAGISVESNVDWTAASDANWCTFSTTSTGLKVNVEANNSYLPRTAKITIKHSSVSAVVNVSQNAPKEPTVDALTVSDINKTTANCQFSYNSSDLIIQKRGVCYSSTKNLPTTSDQCYETTVSSYSGTASYTLSELIHNTTYYVRPYVVTSVGTTYGNVAQFTTLNIISPNESDNPTPNY